MRTFLEAYFNFIIYYARVIANLSLRRVVYDDILLVVRNPSCIIRSIGLDLDLNGIVWKAKEEGNTCLERIL